MDDYLLITVLVIIFLLSFSVKDLIFYAGSMYPMIHVFSNIKSLIFCFVSSLMMIFRHVFHLAVQYSQVGEINTI
ncbi:MAG: hypothetical protein ACOX47_07490 [Bacillota bacterium]